jgi:hypothetical protein
VGRIRGDDSVVASNCSFDDGDVGRCRVIGACSERSDGLCLFLGERFGGAQGDEAGVQCPHFSVVAVGGDQRAGVVRDTVLTISKQTRSSRRSTR